MESKLALAQAVGEVIERRLPSRQNVLRQGSVLEYHHGMICAVYAGVQAVVQEFEIPSGITLCDVNEICEGQTYLNHRHADAIFAEIAPGMPVDLRRLHIANTMGQFDLFGQGGSRLNVLRATILLFTEAAAFENWRVRVDPNRPRPVVRNRIARMGQGEWFARDRHIPRLRRITLSRREIGQIFDRREELVGAN